MYQISRSEVVPYNAEQMFTLVNAVEKYPDFLPWCSQTDILHRDDDEVRASVTATAMGVQKTFTTRNLLQKNKMIEIRLVNGPFKHLEGFWRFENMHEGQGSKISLDLEFEFSGGLLDFAFGPMFHQVANTFVDSFIKRADEVYGKG